MMVVIMDRLTGITDQFRGKFGGLNDLNSPQRAECEMATGTIKHDISTTIKYKTSDGLLI